jgi:hypothetical protein
MLVPYLWNLVRLQLQPVKVSNLCLFKQADMHQSIPMSILAGCGIVGGACVLFLPETGSKPLKDTIREEECEASEIKRMNNNS